MTKRYSDTQIDYVLNEIAGAKDGRLHQPWFRRRDPEHYTRQAALEIECRLCGTTFTSRITRNRNERGQRPAVSIEKHAHEAGHYETARYVLDNRLHPVAPQDKIDDMFAVGWSALVKGNLFPRLGVESVCGVVVGPLWVSKLIGSAWPADECVKVMQLAARSTDFRDALVAASELPDIDSVETFVIQQFGDKILESEGK